MVATLADLSRALGWRATVLDRGAFSAADADESSMVVVATQGHGDEDAVERAVAARPAYLGLVGSAKRGEAVLGYLKDRGVPPDQLDRVRVPAGLDLGRTSHREIAVAILAELVQLRAAGELIPGRVPEQTQASTATDVVCGMTVTADASSYPLEREGVTYYFCCAGCRRSFQENPAAQEKESRC
jgi:xanthine dehydrogenase accessory factor